MAETPGDGATLYEKPSQASFISRSASHSQGIDVVQAEQEFYELSRQLSGTRPMGNQNSAVTVNASNNEDVEKKGQEKEGPFDLREYLASSNDANQEAGIRHKHVGVTWDELQVDVVGGSDTKIYAETFGSSILMLSVAPFLWLWHILTLVVPTKKTATRTILHKSSGILKPGEMCLVLGCPGSGCSTFLKTIANQREGYARISGDVLYAGLSADEMAKYYKGEVVYNEEDDIHIATLTVAQTLAFALSTKTPGPNGRLPGVSRKQFNEQIQDTLLRMLNISHTKKTLVGDEFVRGVSGGERKRVSIAEMMATRARVQCWDNSTRGLDASTALDFVKSLRIMTDVLGQTTFVSLYQAGEGIYELFDKVMVLDEGRQVYYGPPSEARAYFEQLGYKPLPRQSTADYLTGCTDPNERQFASGLTAHDVPSTPTSLEAAFHSSVYSRQLDSNRENYKALMETEKTDQEAFRAAVAADKKKGVSEKSPYTLGFSGQVRALTIRQFQMKIQDKFQLYTSMTFSTILALVIGGAYFGQPLTSNGAFTRGSVIFAVLLTTTFDTFTELPMQMLGRPILRKQTNYSLYRPSAIAIANTLSDMPLSAVRLLVFDIVVYFMANLHRSAGGFWAFHLFNYVAFLTMQGFFRTFGMFCRNFDSAFRIGVFVMPNIVDYCGYLIPVNSMKRWLFWIYYINPIAYVWAGCMENEFMRISLTCDGNSIVPRNSPGVSKYPTELGLNQACTLFGATSGSDIIAGHSYIEAGYGLYVSDLWKRNLLVTIGFMFLFQLTQMLALEYFPQHAFNNSVSIFAKEDEDTRHRNETLRVRREQRNAVKRKESDDPETSASETSTKDNSPISHRKVFTWENLNYHVPVPGGTRRLLHDVYGYVKPGTLTALMGASGAGKTTCLDVLAQRKNIGVVSGDVLVDGRPLASDFARGTAYAEQMDVHEGTSTVREAMRFSAYLRQPADISQEEKDGYVEEMIELLELQDLSEALVMSLNVEARKRLTIGVELAAKPELLLFLDEPTSGLDAQSAWNLVRFLRKLADQGQAILCTIHQPSSLLFESFDRLLLLERGGETVYFGDIGSDSHVIRSYFARHGALCPPTVNPAEFMLEAIGAGVTARIGDRDWKDLWLGSPEHNKVMNDIAFMKAEGLSRPEDTKNTTNVYAASFLYQLRVVVKRNSLALWRSPDYIFTRLFICAFGSTLVSLTFLQLGTSVRDLQFRTFAMFWIIILPTIVMTQIEPLFISNRRIFVRESSSKIYSPYVFAIGQLIGEVPYNIICGIVFWVLLIYPVGFGQGVEGTNGTGFHLLAIMFMLFFGVTLGQLVAALSPSIQVAVLFNPLLGLILATFCGVTIPYSTLLGFWKWLYQLNPYTRAVSAILATELHGLKITCKNDEFAIFNPPSGQSCVDWAGDFVRSLGGYLDNPTSTESCRYCQYSVGDEFYTPMNIRFDNRWRDVFILFSFIVFNIIVTIIASRFLRYAKR